MTEEGSRTASEGPPATGQPGAGRGRCRNPAREPGADCK